jgi:hypothetical protein
MAYNPENFPDREQERLLHKIHQAGKVLPCRFPLFFPGAEYRATVLCSLRKMSSGAKLLKRQAGLFL